MRRQRRRDTACEFILRRAVHAAGLRYRIDASRPMVRRRRADILFTRSREAVVVDGCFWHGGPVHSVPPRNNAAWWPKPVANVARDRDTDRQLESAGWTSLRFWQHEVERSVDDCIDVVVQAARVTP